ncbi:hypothetical protein H632_c4374p0, partial [Helicosporidium sp. ATCC 50920]
APTRTANGWQTSVASSVEKLDQLLRDIRAKTYDGTDSFIKKHRAALAKFRANDIEKLKEKFAAEVPRLYAKHLVKERLGNVWADEYESTGRHVIGAPSWTRCATTPSMRTGSGTARR